jgi:exopolysaccharide production protein ExoZ
MSERLATRPVDPPTYPFLPARIPVEPPPPTPDRTRSGRRLDGLDLLRALASCLVFYTHIASWYRLKQDPMPVSDLLDRWVIGPLHLNKELGFVGVALFLLISGFVMAHVAAKERAGEFGLKRVLRIFPALFVAVLLAWPLVTAGLYGIPGGETSLGVGDVLANMFLVNFFDTAFPSMVAVAWTLVPQLGIYAMIAALLVVFRRAPWIAVAVQITLCSVLLSILSELTGPTVGSLRNIGSFGIAVVLGQVIWLVWARKAPLWAGMLLGLACWVVFVWGDAGGKGRYDDSFPLTLALAMLLVILAVLAGARVPRWRLVTYLSSRSYAVYLVHQTTAFTVLALLWPHLSSALAVPVAIAVTLAVAELLHRAVERPVAALANRLSGRPSG